MAPTHGTREQPAGKGGSVMDTKGGMALVEAYQTEHLSKDEEILKDHQKTMLNQIKSPLRRIRAIALLQQLRKNGTLHKKGDWCKAAKDIGFSSAETERAVNDLVACCFVQLSVKNGELLLEFLDGLPDE